MFVAEQETASSAVMESSDSQSLRRKSSEGKTLKTSSKHFMNLDPTLVYCLKTASSTTKFLSQLLLLLIRKRSFSMKPHNRALPDKAAYNSRSKEKVLDSPKTILKNPQKLSQNLQESCAAQNTAKTTKNKKKNILWKEPESTIFERLRTKLELDWELVSGSEFDYSVLVCWQIGRRSCGENDARLMDGWIDSMTIQNYSCCTCTTKQRRWWELWHSIESSVHLAKCNQIRCKQIQKRLSTRVLKLPFYTACFVCCLASAVRVLESATDAPPVIIPGIFSLARRGWQKKPH